MKHILQVVRAVLSSPAFLAGAGTLALTLALESLTERAQEVATVAEDAQAKAAALLNAHLPAGAVAAAGLEVGADDDLPRG